MSEPCHHCSTCPSVLVNVHAADRHQGWSRPFCFLICSHTHDHDSRFLFDYQFLFGETQPVHLHKQKRKTSVCGFAGATPLSIVIVRLSVSVSSWKVKTDPTDCMEETRNSSNTSPPFSASVREPFCASWRK